MEIKHESEFGHLLPPLVECETLAGIRETLSQEKLQHLRPRSDLADSSE